MPASPPHAAILPSVFALGLVAAVLVAAIRTALHLRRRARLLGVTDEVTRAHVRLLTVKQKQLVLHDGYGNYDLSGWIAHVNYFIDGVILREAKARRIRLDGTAGGERLRAEITRRLLGVVNAAAQTLVEAAPEAPRHSASGQRYEVRCRALLEAAGWSVSMTPQTGDQGADLIADLEGRRVVLQCKFHAKPVGNKAVQEAYTARNMHGADHAAVVSNNSFTRSALELARANDVLLLHHDLLAELRTMIDRARAKPRGRVFDQDRKLTG